MNRDFYNNEIDFKYPEIGICLGMETSTSTPKAKIAIPVATPTLPLSGGAYDNRDLDVNTTNIVSDTTAMDIGPCITSNYIYIDIPKEITDLKDGDKVILIFIGGDINKPVILRRYDE